MVRRTGWNPSIAESRSSLPLGLTSKNERSTWGVCLARSYADVHTALGEFVWIDMRLPVCVCRGHARFDVMQDITPAEVVGCHRSKTIAQKSPSPRRQMGGYVLDKLRVPMCIYSRGAQLSA